MTTGVYNYGSNGFERVINGLFQPWPPEVIIAIIYVVVAVLFTVVMNLCSKEKNPSNK